MLEIKLPPCHEVERIRLRWLKTLERNCRCRGPAPRSSSFPPAKPTAPASGNHLLFGGPSLDENPLFKHPRWITSILRYWQHHPSLAYLFTGHYVGPSSQAPRPDESARELYDLEMAYQFLEKLDPGDHRYLISETLRHLHTDSSGNTHRCETSFDKFWNVGWDGGCRGLIGVPRGGIDAQRAGWMRPPSRCSGRRSPRCFVPSPSFGRAARGHDSRLHDHYFLPTLLWEDFELVLADLKKAGFDFDAKIFYAISGTGVFTCKMSLRDSRQGDAVAFHSQGA